MSKKGRPRYAESILVTRSIRIEQEVLDYIQSRDVNLSLVCRRLLDDFMSWDEIPDGFRFQRSYRKTKGRNNDRKIN